MLPHFIMLWRIGVRRFDHTISGTAVAGGRRRRWQVKRNTQMADILRRGSQISSSSTSELRIPKCAFKAKLPLLLDLELRPC